MMIKRIDKVMREFDVDDPDIWLKATCNIDNIIDFIKGLEEKGYAYATPEGDVYFSVEKFPSYGALSNRKTEEAFSGVRIENEDNKKSALDFALWKSAKMKANLVGQPVGQRTSRLAYRMFGNEPRGVRRSD